MRTRDIGFAVAGTIAAVVCIRLGLWQVDRLRERQAFNDRLRGRAEAPAVARASLPSDTGAARYRRVRVTGTYDFDRELLLGSRSRQGSPGVNIITPLRLPGTDTVLLVNRGWIYAPDGMTADLSRWREPAEVDAEAYVENYQSRPGRVRSESRANVYRWMDREAISTELPYPVAPWYAVLIGNTQDPPANIPPRVPVPPLSEGSHRGYAIQWFSFAAISIIGMILFLRRR